MRKLNYKLYIILLALIILLNNIGFCFTNTSDADPKQVKFGTIYDHEIWQDEIYIIGDVIIPEEVVVTVEAGAQLIFADYDLFQGGKDKSQCEIITYGTIDLQSSTQNPIEIAAINNNNLKILPIDKDTQVIKFYPYKVETEGLRKEFRSFKAKYIILWSLIYLMRVML